MISATIGIAILLSILGWTRRHSSAALGVLIVSMLIWPEFLRIPFGIVQMSVPRLVATALLIKFFSQRRHYKINYNKADTLVILIWLWTIMAHVLSGAEFAYVSQMIGRGFDTVLIYFVARMALTSYKDIKNLYFWLGIIALAMCMAGVYEAITWRSPYHLFNNGASRVYGYSEIRYGFLRASASTSVSIYFGMAMMLITGLLWSIRGYVKNVSTFKLIIFASIVATLSSMSSGPWLAIFTLIGINLFYNRPSLIKPALYGLVFISMILEVASNRHFYNLIDYLALDPHTAWYRTRLIEIAVEQWRDYWLIGVGSEYPNHWAALLDGRQYIDVVNNFIIIALYGGLPAMFMYIAVHFIAIKRSVRAYLSDRDIPRRKLIFGLAATLVALDISSLSVGLYGPPLMLSYILMGMIVSITMAWDANRGEAKFDDIQ